MAQSTHKKRKLLNFSIQRALQVQMILRLALILFISLFICSLAYYYFADIKITNSFRLFHIHAKNFLDFLLPMVIAAFFISLLAGIIAILFFPKNFAGSLYRIEQDVREIATGNLSVHIDLRKNDQIQSLAESINQLVNMMRIKLATIQENAEKINTICSSQEIPEKNRSELKGLCGNIRNELHSLKLSDP
ncbi:MAG: hypothetical protein C0403_01095 [Desulfobacterium sp.]|nr:hypothetical protein [Desulfobacterium sp.]